MAQKRLELLSEMSELVLVPEVFLLAEKLIANGPIPTKAETDALHISAATVGGMDYLLTWNCTHIANAQMQNSIRSICLEFGLKPPVICTPWELLGDEGYVEG